MKHATRSQAAITEKRMLVLAKWALKDIRQDVSRSCCGLGIDDIAEDNFYRACVDAMVSVLQAQISNSTPKSLVATIRAKRFGQRLHKSKGS